MKHYAVYSMFKMQLLDMEVDSKGHARVSLKLREIE